VSESKMLDISKGNFVQVGRIGYPDEGIRLTFCDGFPYNLHFEIQLSRCDAEFVINALTNMLNSKEQDNLIIGIKKKKRSC